MPLPSGISNAPDSGIMWDDVTFVPIVVRCNFALLFMQSTSVWKWKKVTNSDLNLGMSMYDVPQVEIYV